MARVSRRQSLSAERPRGIPNGRRLREYAAQPEADVRGAVERNLSAAVRKLVGVGQLSGKQVDPHLEQQWGNQPRSVPGPGALHHKQGQLFHLLDHIQYESTPRAVSGEP